MSGLRKAKKYDWKDSNMALFGSDTEKQVKKESAESEPAWKGAGQKIGLQIWRINKFKVECWTKEEYGKFYTGDSYIVLNTYKEKDSDALLYDVHFWIGKYSTQDEYGTAAYKTVELDTLLDDKPIQHREVQGHESDLFKKYFNQIQYLEGGADTGFRHVVPEQYQSRLLQFKKTGRSITITEVPRKRSLLESGDVFILDSGLMVYQWKGKDCSKDESFKAAGYMTDIISERNGKPDKEVLEEEDIPENHKFYDLLDQDDEEDEEEDEDDSEGVQKLLKVSDEDGSLDTEEVKEGRISMDDLDSKDVMIIDLGKSLYVWIGKDASENESRNGLPYAHSYLQGTKHSWANVTVLREGQNCTIPGVA